MKNTCLIILLVCCSLAGYSQTTNLKVGVFKNYNDFTDNDEKKQDDLTLTPLVRINKLDKKYSDTLYRLNDESRKPFAVYNGTSLYIRTEDTLFRKMDYVGHYPFVKITTKVYLEDRWITVNKTPIFEEAHEDIQSYVAFIDKKGNWVVMGFTSIRELIFGNHDLVKAFDREKWNNDIFLKYLLKMNERFPIK